MSLRVGRGVIVAVEMRGDGALQCADLLYRLGGKHRSQRVRVQWSAVKVLSMLMQRELESEDLQAARLVLFDAPHSSARCYCAGAERVR